jgi:hypothetical protein
MNKIRVLCFLLLMIVTISFIGACSSQSLSDVSSIVPKLYQDTQSSGYGSADTDIQLDTTFPKAPDQMKVYIITKVDDQRAFDIAKQFGMENDPVPLIGDERMVYSFANNEEILEINLDGSMHLYQCHTDIDTSASLPSEDECINIAREYLKSKDLYPENVVRTQVGICETVGIAEKEKGQATEIPTKMRVLITTNLDGYENNYTMSRVVIGDLGKVLELNYNNPVLTEYGVVRVKTPIEAYNMLTAYIKDPSFNSPYQDECIVNWRGSERLVIHNISLAYTAQTSKLSLQPVYIFEGEVFLANQDAPEHFIGFVDAVQR